MERIDKRPVEGTEECWRGRKTGFTASVTFERPDEPHVLEIRFGGCCEMGLTEMEAEQAFLNWCDATRRTRLED